MMLLVSAVSLILAFSNRTVALIYVCLFLTSTARAFQWPASSALLPQTVAPAQLTSAIGWQGTAREMATVGGPAFAGFLIAWKGSQSVYLIQGFSCLLSAIFYALMTTKRVEDGDRPPMTWKGVGEGIRFVWEEKTVLGALLLDLLAVFFGGAVTLLPIFAQDILKVGATGLGWLRAAPAFGAGLMAFALAHRGHIRNAGSAMLLSVAGFGLATIGFAFAGSAWVAFLMLFLTGVFDSVSVVLRLSLVQTRTPDHLRGRVSAVNGLFIAASNQWGAVESGLAAAWLGTVPSVIFGGAASIGVVILIALLFPALRMWKNDPHPQHA
jgi:MFS family permease